MYDFVMFTCIGYKLPTFWEWISIGEDSVRPSAAGLRNALFPRSEAKGKLVLFRSQQRRLRLVLLQQRGNSSVICRALSRQFHIWIDQQRGNMLVFSLCSR